MKNSRNVEQLLEEYEPDNFKLIMNPFIKEKQKRKEYIGCCNEYPMGW